MHAHQEAGSELREAVRAFVAAKAYDEAWSLLRDELVAGSETSPYELARLVLRSAAGDGWTPPTSRSIRLGVLATYEASELVEYVSVACAAFGIEAALYIGAFGQVEQELLVESSGLRRFEPTHVLLAPTTADLGLPAVATDRDQVEDAERRWTQAWERVHSLGARALQHGFVVPDESPLGHLASRLPLSRVGLVRELNARLGAAAGADVLLVDCERLAARLGKQAWFDPRLWFAARRPYSQQALPSLARDTAAVLAADVGLAAKCLVVDLDNTLWGGVVGEEGWSGITIGEGPEGEAFSAFQEYLLELSGRGVLLAVASKNDAEAAREPFERNPHMLLRAEHFAAFVADWRRKPEQIADIADRLGLGLDALVFVDDNAAECAEVAAALPAVTTVTLDVPPSEYVRKLAGCPRFEASWLTAEDRQRQAVYAARAGAEEARTAAASIEDFWRSLEMKARVSTLGPGTLERAAQLVGKTNQFNLTLLRRSREELDRLRADGQAICKVMELQDRFADHGTIGLAIATPDATDPETAVIDTLLLSCRVIGRTAETHLLGHVAREARAAGFKRLRGVYTPGPRNGLVADLYPQLGFVPANGAGGAWTYELRGNALLESPYIVDVE